MVRLLKRRKKLVSNWWKIWWEFMTDLRWDETRIRWGVMKKAVKWTSTMSTTSPGRKVQSGQRWPRKVQLSTLTALFMTKCMAKNMCSGRRWPVEKCSGRRRREKSCLVNGQQLPFSWSIADRPLHHAIRWSQIFETWNLPIFCEKNDSENKFML